MGQRTSVYLDDALQTAVKASATPLAELIRRGLSVEAERGSQPQAEEVVSKPSPLSGLPSGEPSPGAVCATPLSAKLS